MSVNIAGRSINLFRNRNQFSNCGEFRFCGFNTAALADEFQSGRKSTRPVGTWLESANPPAFRAAPQFVEGRLGGPFGVRRHSTVLDGLNQQVYFGRMRRIARYVHREMV
jgi:hypothetical protein